MQRIGIHGFGSFDKRISLHKILSDNFHDLLSFNVVRRGNLDMKVTSDFSSFSAFKPFQKESDDSHSVRNYTTSVPRMNPFFNDFYVDGAN